MVAADEEATAKPNGPFTGSSTPGRRSGWAWRTRYVRRWRQLRTWGPNRPSSWRSRDSRPGTSVVLGDPALAERPDAQDYPRERSVASPPSTPIT